MAERSERRKVHGMMICAVCMWRRRCACAARALFDVATNVVTCSANADAVAAAVVLHCHKRLYKRQQLLQLLSGTQISRGYTLCY